MRALIIVILAPILVLGLVSVLITIALLFICLKPNRSEPEDWDQILKEGETRRE